MLRRPTTESAHPVPTPPLRILVLFAHPAVQKSRFNVRLFAAARTVEGVTAHDLYEAYPDYQIDVAREQALLLEHEVIVFQHPFYWYSGPALLKEWQDLVLEHGFAYGRGGDRLRGKWLLNAITTGGRQEAYCREGHNFFTIRELLTPFEQTARLCGMEYLPPFVVHGTIRMSDTAGMEAAADDYSRILRAIRDGRVDPDAVRDRPRLAADAFPAAT